MPIKGTSLPRQPLSEIVGKEGERLVPIKFNEEGKRAWGDGEIGGKTL
jgi:hypothetical protein